MRYFLVISFVFFLVSCTKEAPTSPVDVPVVSSGVSTKTVEDPNQKLIEEAKSEHSLVFDGEDSKKLKVYHTSGTPTKVVFKNYDAKSMSIILDFLDDKKPNLRLTRVIMPDGTMDGPFWDRTGINLTQKGEYQLLFHENQMAGDLWSGIVDMTFTLLPTEFPEPGVALP